jgi:Rod binding domain-containing protein
MLPVATLVPATLTQSGGSSSLASRSDSANSRAAQEIKLRKAAGEFESMLLNSMWKSMKETFTDQDDQDSDPTLESFDDWGMQAMSNAVGNAGGLGIKNLIIKHLEPTISGEGSAVRADS